MVLLRVLQRGLERIGFDVVAKRNSTAALDCLVREPFDLLVTDFRMPVMNGLELLRSAADARAPVPSIVISGSLEATTRDFAQDLGVIAFLKKPFSLVKLQNCAARAVGGRHAASRASPEGDQTW